MRLFAALLLFVAPLAAAQAPQAEDTRPRVVPERFTLDNGTSVVLIPFPNYNGISVQAWYELSALDEPAGVPDATRLLAKMRDTAAFDGYIEEEAFGLLNEIGDSVTHALPSHLRTSYLCQSDDLDLVLSIEAARLRGIEMTDAMLATQHAYLETEVLDRIEQHFNQPFMTHALQAAGHVWNHGAEHVSFRESPDAASLEEIRTLAENTLVPARLTLFLFGGFESDATLDMIKQHFAALPAGDAPEPENHDRPGFATATWDVDATVILAAYTPPDDILINATAICWGPTLAGRVLNHPDLKGKIDGVTASRLDYPAGRMPAFVYARIKPGENAEAIAEIFADRIEALAREEKSRMDFAQLPRTANMFRGRYILDADTVKRQAQQIARRQDVKGAAARLRAIQPINDNFAFIEFATGPAITDTCNAISMMTEPELIDALSTIYTPENRSVLLIRPVE